MALACRPNLHSLNVLAMAVHLLFWFWVTSHQGLATSKGLCSSSVIGIGGGEWSLLLGHTGGRLTHHAFAFWPTVIFGLSHIISSQSQSEFIDQHYMHEEHRHTVSIRINHREEISKKTFRVLILGRSHIILVAIAVTSSQRFKQDVYRPKLHA